MLIQATLRPSEEAAVNEYLGIDPAVGTKAELVRRALDEYITRRRSELEGVPADAVIQQTNRLQDAIEGVIDFLPAIDLRQEDTAPINVGMPLRLLRAIDVLRQTPGVRLQTREDVVRVMVHSGLQAVDHLIAVEDDTWRSCIALGRRVEAYEAQQALVIDAAKSAALLRDTLAGYIDADQVTNAIDEWVRYYEDVSLMPEGRREYLLRALRGMPAARIVAWMAKDTGLIPKEFIPDDVEFRDPWGEEGIPSGGLMKDAHAKEIAASYHRGYRAGRASVVKGGGVR